MMCVAAAGIWWTPRPSNGSSRCPTREHSRPGETLLRLYVRNILPDGFTWTSQVTVLLDPDGRPWKHLIADLSCPELRIALFYDGTYHRAEERRSLDFHQVQRLRALSWEAVRVDAALMAEVDKMMEDMGDAVSRAVAAG